MGVNQTWNTSYENSPAAGDNPGGGDNAIRNLKTSVSTRVGKEHYFPTDDNLGRQGIHRQGSAVAYFTDSEPQLRPPSTGGTAFEEDIDEGRLWIDTSTGKLKYIKSIDETGTPTWGVVQVEAVGKIAAFATPPANEERWLPCDGREINNTEESIDGEVEGYAALVTKLLAEVSGEEDHPYYAPATGTVKLPDLRGVGLRGLDNYGAVSGLGAANRDTASRENWDGDDVSSFNWSGSYQTDNIIDHRHEMNHTHGIAVTDGLNEGNGRTGVPDWNAGNPDPGEETDNFKGDTYITEAGVLTMRDPGDDSPGGGAITVANDKETTVDLQHYHTIPGFYGRTSTFAEEAEDVLHGVPEPQDINYADEATMKNVGVYWFIKY